MDLNKKKIDTIVRFALKEDIWTGDITTDSILQDLLIADAVIVSRQKGIVCGMDIIESVFSCVDEDLKFRPQVKDGDRIEPEKEIAFIEGSAKAILKAERTALNFLSLLSGIATKTRKIDDLIQGAEGKVYDTRKTIPLFRYLEKYAVRVGGGANHRQGLWDMVLIKDNHIRAFAMQQKEKDSRTIIKNLIKQTRANIQKNIKIEIEVETLKECEYAMEETPDIIMLDNMSPEIVKKAVMLRKEKGLEGKVFFEVSGGITEETVKKFADTGVERISIGALTNSIESVDFSLEVIYRA